MVKITETQPLESHIVIIKEVLKKLTQQYLDSTLFQHWPIRDDCDQEIQHLISNLIRINPSERIGITELTQRLKRLVKKNNYLFYF